ncbi:hypothetical protein CLCR_01731 [Cladophialophora carrionii]|uniref:Uncharacterized protein n=1 Tax=Cladophialophora carrionii TaxID=86049 RepID=A0A1C1CAR1_9EURO|nr:hypothetical protein CLCR_01731 [Cladophialophora carrionii]
MSPLFTKWTTKADRSLLLPASLCHDHAEDGATAISCAPHARPNQKPKTAICRRRSPFLLDIIAPRFSGPNARHKSETEQRLYSLLVVPYGPKRSFVIVTTAKDFSVSLTLRLKSQFNLTNTADHPNLVRKEALRKVGAHEGKKVRNRQDLQPCRSSRGSKEKRSHVFISYARRIL